VTPESIEVTIPVLFLKRSCCCQHAISFVPSAEQATETQEVPFSVLAVQDMPESAEV
jgi:hypothetical protein